MKKIIFFGFILFSLFLVTQVQATRETSYSKKNCVPTSSEVISATPTVEVVPTVVEEPTAGVSATMAPTAPVVIDPVVKTHGDGLSDGKSSCPECTKAHDSVSVPQAAPATGRAE